jgi:hypothetical protein
LGLKVAVAVSVAVSIWGVVSASAICAVSLPDISNNVGPVKLFLKTLLSFHLKEFFSFVFLSFSFFSASTTTARL